MKKGYLITFEGLDGSGKTTALKKIIPELQNCGHDVVTFREPGGTKFGDLMRAALFEEDLGDADFSERAELLAFLASRAQNVQENIRPSLEEGKIVVLDRFVDSSTVYQGYANGIGCNLVHFQNVFATKGLRPDLTLLFDIVPEEAVKRRQKSSFFGEEFNRLDEMELNFHQKVWHAYRTLYAFDDEGRWERVDANKSPDEVYQEALTIIEGRLAGEGILEGQMAGAERRG